MDAVATLVKPMLPIPLSDDAMHGVVVAVTGAAKALAVQLAEAAQDVAGGAAVSESHMVSPSRARTGFDVLSVARLTHVSLC